MTQARFHVIISILTIIAIALASLNWLQSPEYASKWLAGLLAMPIIWVIASWIIHKRPLESLSEDQRRYFTNSVIGAGLIMIASLALKMASAGNFLEASMHERIWGVIMGIVLIYFGNLTPKILSPLTREKCSAPVERRLKLFTGWTFVLAGIAYAISWVALPIHMASTVAMSVVAFAVVLVLLRCGLALISARKQG
jgi:hypothetical protein